MNNNIKDWIGRSGTLTLATVNRKIEEYVKTQQQEFEMVIYSNGPYELSHSHSILRKDRHVWNAVATDERHESWKRFWLSPLTLPSIQQTEIEKPPVRVSQIL
jgi:hypothetical protein